MWTPANVNNNFARQAKLLKAWSRNFGTFNYFKIKGSKNMQNLEFEIGFRGAKYFFTYTYTNRIKGNNSSSKGGRQE